MNNKFFIFGNHPELSLAELNALIDCQNGEILNESFFYLPEAINLVPNSFIDSLGGTIKIGEVIKIFKVSEKKLALDYILELLIKEAKASETKFNFAFSDYSSNFLPNNFGLSCKKELKRLNLSSRLVFSKEAILSSVVVDQNKLIKKGIELVIASDNEKILIGKTEAVQDYKDFSKRDYGRPARDDHSGMLPPKLAKIMINLVGYPKENSVLLDPFCGSGTILNEAVLNAYRKIIGADISKKAISDSKINLEWIKNQYNLDSIDARFINRSVLNLSKVIKENSIDCIVTEPYLGPQRNLVNIKLVKEELEGLYSLSLLQFEKILKKDGLVVMIWPVFLKNTYIEPNYSNWVIIEPIKKDWSNNIRKTLVYGRLGQKVWREIVILRKK